jgi:hypothetical protein
VLRLLRDSTSVVGSAYVEIDLEAMFHRGSGLAADRPADPLDDPVRLVFGDLVELVVAIPAFV